MKEIGIIDIETTGFLNQGGLIVEIGIVSLDLESGKAEEKYNSLICEKGLDDRHTRYPFGWIFKNSDLNYQELLSAPTFESEKEKIKTILQEFELGVTAYNKKFDFGFLNSRGITVKELPCPIIVATPILNLPGKYGAKWPSVEEAWKFLIGEPYVEAHRALDDALHEAKIIYELYKLGVFKID